MFQAGLHRSLQLVLSLRQDRRITHAPPLPDLAHHGLARLGVFAYFYFCLQRAANERAPLRLARPPRGWSAGAGESASPARGESALAAALVFRARAPPGGRQRSRAARLAEKRGAPHPSRATSAKAAAVRSPGHHGLWRLLLLQELALRPQPALYAGEPVADWNCSMGHRVWPHLQFPGRWSSHCCWDISVPDCIGGIDRCHQTSPGVALLLYDYPVVSVCYTVFGLMCLPDIEQGTAEVGWNSTNNTKQDIERNLDCCGFHNVSEEATCAADCFKSQSCHPCAPVIEEFSGMVLRFVGGIGLFFSFTEILGVWLTYRYRNQKDPRANPSAFL